jgi:uncharacterized protein (DUF362 family)
MPLEPNVVFCAKAPAIMYATCPYGSFPELPQWAEVTTALSCLRSLFFEAGLDGARYGSADWNPLGAIISPQDKIVIKPNWVHHWNGTGKGLDCLITHPSVIEAILHYVAKARPRSIAVCDAPIQGCDFEALMASCRVKEMIESFQANDVDIMVKDWRCTIRPSENFSDRTIEGCRPREDYILYDLAHESALDAISTAQSDFRVTMYDPDLLNCTHGRGKHQYVIARDAIEADVVINVPKLKTHKKACITGALKNMVGMNGHKEYLRMIARRALSNMAVAGMAVAKLFGEDNNYDGSWHGNDTVWRMTLDIQRILHYGMTDGTLNNQVQRRVLTITDAIIAGQGEGPLSTTPVDLGIMTLGMSPPAIEWVHAILMGLNPERIPLTRESFSLHRYPLVHFRPSSIVIRVQGSSIPSDDLFMKYGKTFQLPAGWQGHVETRHSKYESNSDITV